MIRIGVVITPSLQQTLDRSMDIKVERVMEQMSQILPTKTPKRSGAASRAWRKEGRGKNTIILNTIPYIERLEDGISSQAPNGIIEPALRELRSQKRR